VKNLDDNALFEKICRESSLTAYEVLFDRYWLKLYAAAKSRLQDEDEAKDCVQEVFVNIWTKRESLPNPGSVKGYLLISIKNRILNSFRQKMANEKHLQEYLNEWSPSTEEYGQEFEMDEMEAIVTDEIKRMPEQMRRIFLLSRDEGLSGIEIAEKLSISHQTVRNQISTSLKRIRQRIEKFRSQF